jgi:adenosylmethionine-8-amino-7-oxononanoate aminotransferase
MQDYVQEEPLIIESGSGCTLRDIGGKEYLDGVSSLWTNVHGHRKAEIDAAIMEQLGKIAHSTLLGLSNVPAIRCAKKLVAIAPEGLRKVFYSDNGSTAVEVALKMAFQYHRQARSGSPQKTKFITLANAYHGDTIGSVSLGGIDLFHATYRQLLFHSLKAASPYCYRCPFGKTYPDCKTACLSQMEALMEEHAPEVAALVIEPLVQGAAGMIVQPPGYLKGVRELCTRHNIIMIADEVAVGFGRTGRMFACEHEHVRPDIMAVAKGITGGYLPLAATLTTEKIYEGFLGNYEEFKTLFHGHTYTGNPLACAAAVANMEIFAAESTVDKLQAKIARLQERLEEIKLLKHVGEIRQRGFMVGIELVADRGSREEFLPGAKIGHQVTLAARKRGLIIRPLGNVIVLMPPLSITSEELDRLCDITADSIREVTEPKKA